MLPLSSAMGGYTNDELEMALRDGSGAYTCRFEVLDPTLAHLFDLDTVVMGAIVEMNVDRVVKGSLGLTMLPNADVNVGPYRYRLKPWWQFQMPDGGMAEWPMGVYVWNVPARTKDGSNDPMNSAVGDETWALTLGDQLQVLQLSGPGPSGFKVAAGQVITNAIKTALTLAGFSTAGVEDSAATAQSDLVWSIKTANAGGEAGTSWYDILADLHGKIGYYSPWFDLTGLYRATPQPDLQSASPSMTYETARDGLMLTPLTTGGTLEQVANRVICRATNANGLAAATVSDLNTLYPGHPLSQGVIGFYIDVILDDQVSTTTAGLQRNGDAELNRRMSAYQTLSTPALAWPVHEAFDVIGIEYMGDSELDMVQTFHERRWTFDLRAATMTHELRRISAL